MENTIALGGVWADWQSRLDAADARALTAEQSEYCMACKYEEQQNELEQLRGDYQTLAHSLTSLSLVDKGNKEILEIIKCEKFNLEKRTAGLEASREYQEEQVALMKEKIVMYEAECADWIGRVDKQMTESDNQKAFISKLQQQLVSSEQAIEALKKQLQQRAEQVDTLTHSNDTKSRQLSVLCKERDRLKLENKALAASSNQRSSTVRPSSASPQPVYSTPSKLRVASASPISVAATPPPAAPSPRKHVSPSVDPYDWLLDTRPNAPSPSSGGPASMTSILKKIGSPMASR